jgi:hypothetical protein
MLTHSLHRDVMENHNSGSEQMAMKNCREHHLEDDGCAVC